MTTRTTPRDDLFADFRAARGQASDEDWAMRSWMALVLHGQVTHGAADAALREVLELVRESGEGPDDLYGPADEWARERIAEWAGQGSDVLRDEPSQWRDLPSVAGVGAVFLSLLLGVIAVTKGEWSISWTIGWVLLPFLGPAICLAAITTWERTVARHSIPVGAMSAAAVGIAGSCATATLFALTNPHPLAHASVAWCLPLAGGYAVLTWLLGRLLPSRAVTHRPMDDDVWAAKLARILRTRGDTTDDQVHHVLDEARSHAAEAGSTLQQEFGSPAAYATQISPRPVVRARRSMLYRIGILALWTWLCWDSLTGSSSWTARIFYWTGWVCLALAAISVTVKYLRFTHPRDKDRATDPALDH